MIDGSWLQITGGTGTDSGAFQVTYDANTSEGERSGTVRISAPDGTALPRDLSFTQGACVPPGLPSNVIVTVVGSEPSGGVTFSILQIAWDTASDATEYEIRFGLGVEFESAEIAGTTAETSITFRSPVADLFGCAAPTGVTFRDYDFWVLSRNACADSEPVLAQIQEKRDIYAAALPARGITAAKDGAAELAVRLRADAPIDSGSVWAEIEGGALAGQPFWRAITENDGWVVALVNVDALDGAVRMTAGAATQGGVAIDAAAQRFDTAAGYLSSGVWQPQPGVDYDTAALLDGEDGLAELSQIISEDSAIDGAFQAGPDASFDAPRRLWLPVPDGVDSATATVYYRHGGVWHTAAQVLGWLADEDYLQLDIDGQTYLGLRINHGGLVTVAPGEAAATKDAAILNLPGFYDWPLPVRPGDLAVLLTLFIGLAAARRGRGKKAHS